ncbi:MAG: hypothetical protein V3U24_04750 [Candidatus Neomarinimicrobiota bacterium]
MKLRRHLFIPTLVAVSLAPLSFVASWGFKAHQAINREAVRMLPDELGRYFLFHIEYIAEHAVDPDLWRDDTLMHPKEGRGHYIDVDLYDDYPFRKIPRSREDLISTYSEEKIDDWGTAPWRIERYFNRLVGEFHLGKWDEARLTAAALGHYVSDLHMPLHVVENYNGQLSGNEGVHMRWEEDMVDRYLLGNIHPKGQLTQLSDPVEQAFRIIAESYPVHATILKADSLARKNLSPEERLTIADRGQSMAGSGYLEVLHAETGDLAKLRMEQAAIGVASFWYSAWILAGRPNPFQ